MHFAPIKIKNKIEIKINIIVPTRCICNSTIKNLGMLRNFKVVTERFKVCDIQIAEWNKAIWRLLYRYINYKLRKRILGIVLCSGFLVFNKFLLKSKTLLLLSTVNLRPRKRFTSVVGLRCYRLQNRVLPNYRHLYEWVNLSPQIEGDSPQWRSVL